MRRVLPAGSQGHANTEKDKPREKRRRHSARPNTANRFCRSGTGSHVGCLNHRRRTTTVQNDARVLYAASPSAYFPVAYEAPIQPIRSTVLRKFLLPPVLLVLVLQLLVVVLTRQQGFFGKSRCPKADAIQFYHVPEN